MRRLYVGGLSHTVTEKDLKDRFGKFGAVEDVELRTRRDPEGVPFKTFGYININISDADLKKCLTVLNKSKWKGGTLQIEIAKESFLHRLAQERQEATEQHLRQPAAEDKRQKLLDSLSKSGVDNFTMKAAVPGTEIPGHKDWVVSKFGRVLPILQLRKGNKSRTLKYDPSKYSHNIRKLDRDATPDEFTPITQLTWEVQGGNDDISKKRRGEFPPFEPWRPKKSRTDDASGRTRFEHPVNSVRYSEAHRLSNGFEKQNNHRPAQRKWRHFSDSDVDSDEEIRRLVAAQQSSLVTPQQQQQQQEVEEETLEVVGYDFLAKSARKGDQDDDDDDYDSTDTDELFASRKPPPPECQEKHTPATVEHLSGNNMDKKRKAKKSKAGEQEEEDGSTDDEEHLTSRKPSSVQQKGDSEQKLNKKTAVVKPSLSQSESDEDDENEVDSADSCSDSDYEAMFSNVTHLEISLADLQKLAEEAQQNSKTTAPSILGAKLEQNRTLTFGPAEQSAPKKGTTPEEILAAIMEDDSSEDEQKQKKTKRKAVMSAPLPAFQGTKAMSEVLETDEHKKGQEEEEEEEDGRGREVKKQRMSSDAPQLVHKATDSKTSTSVRDQKHAEAKISDSSGQEEDDVEEDEEDDDEEHESDDVEEEEDMAAPDVFKMVQNRVCVIPEKAEIESSSSNDDEEEEEEEERVNASQTVVKAKSSSSPSSCSSSGDDENEQQIICAEGPVEAALSSETSTSEEEEVERPPPRMALGAEEEEERQRLANMRRLAAVQQRQKEAEEHKKLIQGALASLDAPAAGAGKHIVFGSDDDNEDDGDDKGRMVSEVSTSKKTLFQASQSEDEATGDEAAANGSAKVKEKMRLKSSGPQLFGSSDDEDDDAKEEEEDGSRFEIKPQFEGQAGQKLMALQSRFGTDERFRMDSRFLEEDEEDKEDESREAADAETKTTLVEDDKDLEEERKKNLSILQSVLGQQQCSSKTAGKAKKFRDVSALHYDPSKEEHAAFETKKDEIKKESKAARKKKREEEQKLPEVPKEIYYDVSGDLKAVFGQSKHETAEQEEKTNWDQMEEEEGTEKEEEFAPLASVLSAPSAENEDSSGFQFSFFGDDAEAESKETAEYKVEAIQAPKVSWHQDPRFHDSSSEEEEDEQEEDEEQSSATAKTTEAVTPSHTDFFFFYADDDRLTEGPKLFCRVSELEEQREDWEERRSALRQEYRKKHRDAKRKLMSSLKS